MAEGKRCEIHLLDDRKLEMILQPKLLSRDLVDIVVSHFNIREKEYFGIWFFNDVNEKKWLRHEKKVLDHSFASDTSPVSLSLGVRLYAPSFALLNDSKTIELFYLQAIKSLAQGELVCDFKTMPLLAAYVMQTTNGDYISESITIEDFKNMRLFPKMAHPNLRLEEIVSHYKRMAGLRRGDAIVNYLNIVERLPMYGSCFFIVKDKNESTWKLGISHRGICVYNLEEDYETKEIYTWNRIENLFYRDRKFSLEIKIMSRSGSSNSINSLGRYSNINRRSGQKLDVVTWFLENSVDCRELWSISVGYHQLYVNHRGSKGTESRRTLKDIAIELTVSTSSIALSSDSKVAPSSYSRLSIDQAVSVSEFDKDLYKHVCSQLITALNTRKQFLEMLLHKRESLVNKICLWESGILNLQRINNVSTSLKFIDDIFDQRIHVQQLKKDLKIQCQIKELAKELANTKFARRKETQQLQDKATAKVDEMNQRLEVLRKHIIEKEQPDGTGLNLEMNYETKFDREIALQKYAPEIPMLPAFANSSVKQELVLKSQCVKGGKVGISHERYFPEEKSREETEKEKYLFGEFDNSGIYSCFQNSHLNNSVNSASALKGSFSSTQLSSVQNVALEKAAFNSKVSHYCESDQRSEARYTRNEQVDTFLVRTSKPNIARTTKDSYVSYSGNSNYSSLLSSAAWSQLSQPPLEKLAKNFDKSLLTEDELLMQLSQNCTEEKFIVKQMKSREEPMEGSLV